MTAFSQARLEQESSPRVTRYKVKILVTFILLIVTWPLLGWLAARLLIVSAPLEKADAIVLLSGSSSLRERAAHAARAYSAGRSSLIVVTNDGLRGSWSNAEQRNPFYYEITTWELVRLGVPQDRIVVLMDPVASTYEEASELREHFKQRQLTSALVVTSAYHSRRALWTFNRVFAGSGVTVGVDSAPTGWQTPSEWTWWLKPRGWKSVPGEYLKLSYYWVKY